MRQLTALAGLALALTLSVARPTPVQAQSDSGLGFVAGEAELAGQGGGGGETARATLGSIWQIGGHQTVQLDLGYVDYGQSAIGHVAGHLTLQPAFDRKYGVFGVYEDLNEASVYGLLGGVEGMWALSPALWAEAQVGAGVMQPASTDFIFAAGRLNRAVGAVEIGLGYQIAEVDELDMGLTVQSVELGAELDVETGRGALQLGGALRHDRISGTGPGAGQDDTSLVLSVGWRFGNGARSDVGGRGTDEARAVGSRLFRTPHPLGPLWRAGVMRF
ncbi:MAG: hypothetical protein ABNH26_09520 [Celeribacter sp.]|jgi:hypothetical protein